MNFNDFYADAIKNGKSTNLGRILFSILMVAILFIMFTTGGDGVYNFFEGKDNGTLTFWTHLWSGLGATFVYAVFVTIFMLIGFGLYMLYGWIRYGDDLNDTDSIYNDFDFSNYTRSYQFVFYLFFGTFPEKEKIFHPDRYAREVLTSD